MTNSKKLIAAGGLALALALGSAGAAHAGTNIVSGNVCMAYYGPEMSQNLGQGVYHTSYGTESIHADLKARAVMCPFWRDQYNLTTGLTKLEVNHTMRAGATGSTSCLGYVLTKYGSVKKSVWKTAASTGSSTMTWTDLNVSDNGSGAFDLYCTLAYKGSINSILWQEP
jgi:hypothetical protein